MSEDAINGVAEAIDGLFDRDQWTLLANQSVEGYNSVKVWRSPVPKWMNFESDRPAPKWMNFESDRPAFVLLSWRRIDGKSEYTSVVVQDETAATLRAAAILVEFDTLVKQVKRQASQPTGDDLSY